MKFSLQRSARSRMTTEQAKPGRQGIALIEVIVAMVLLAVAVSSLAALMYSVNQQGMKATGNAYKNGVLMQEVNRLEGIPYDSIPTGVVSFSVTGGKYPHTRTVTVTEPVVQQVKAIQVVVTPVNTLYKPDTAQFTRTKARTSRVLCTTCGG